MESVTLKPGKYSLSRIQPDDRSGDSGPLLISISFPDCKRSGEMGEIKVGCCIECGSINARSYAAQDFWITTPVTKIISVNEDLTEVIFETKNSTYKARSF